MTNSVINHLTQTGKDFTLIVAIISAGSAVVGALIGGIISYLITKIQIRATIISASRREWISLFRDIVSKFLSKVAFLNDSLILPQADRERIAQEIFYLHSQIHMLVNQTEPPIQSFINNIEEIFNEAVPKIGHPNVDIAKISSLRDKIIGQMQVILKNEWIRVKKGV